MVLRNLESSSRYILHSYISMKVGFPKLRKLKNVVVNKLMVVFFRSEIPFSFRKSYRGNGKSWRLYIVSS